MPKNKDDAQSRRGLFNDNYNIINVKKNVAFHTYINITLTKMQSPLCFLCCKIFVHFFKWNIKFRPALISTFPAGRQANIPKCNSVRLMNIYSVLIIGF